MFIVVEAVIKLSSSCHQK